MQAGPVHCSGALREGRRAGGTWMVMLGILGEYLWRALDRAATGRDTWSNGVPMDVERAPHPRRPADLRPGCS
jgi:hypothetical protein